MLTRAHGGGVRRQSSFPQRSDASGAKTKAAGASLTTCSWLMTLSASAAATRGQATVLKRIERASGSDAKRRSSQPTRETSGREECFLSPNARAGAGRARWPPWQCSNPRANGCVLVKWKILDAH